MKILTVRCPGCGVRVQMQDAPAFTAGWVKHDVPVCDWYRTEILGKHGTGRTLRIVEPKKKEGT